MSDVSLQETVERLGRELEDLRRRVQDVQIRQEATVQSMGEAIAESVHGENHGLWVKSRRYGDLVVQDSGLVWLHPESPLRLDTIAGFFLEFVFDLDAPADQAYAASRTGGVRIHIGPQTWQKLIPMNLDLIDSTPSLRTPGLRFLIQMEVAGQPYPTPLLKLQYSTFWKEVHQGDAEARIST